MTSADLPPVAQQSALTAVHCDDLHKSYGARPAIRNLSVTIGVGERVAVFGDNGAGKSTLLQLLSGLLRPSEGRIQVFGAQPWGREGGRVRAQIGSLSHQSHLYEELSAKENLALYGRLNGVPDAHERADTLISDFGLVGRRGDPVRTLSRGMTQRVSLMRALIHRPALLLLDEPETGLDAVSRDMLTAHITEQGPGVTVVLATHNIEMGIALTTRDIVLRNGEIVYDSAAGGDTSLDAEQRRQAVTRRLGARVR